MEIDYKTKIDEKKAEAKRIMTREQFNKCERAIFSGIIGNPTLAVLADMSFSNRINMVDSLAKIFERRLRKGSREDYFWNVQCHSVRRKDTGL